MRMALRIILTARKGYTITEIHFIYNEYITERRKIETFDNKCIYITNKQKRNQ